MAEDFLQLSSRDRLDALGYVEAESGRPVHLLEKDVWVVWALATLFNAPVGKHLVFKGGTSLSKAYDAIRRFSEDVDLTYDIRALLPDVVSHRGDALPPNRSQERRWTRMIRGRLDETIAKEIVPVLEHAIHHARLPAVIRVEGANVYLDYEAVAGGSGYVNPSVMLEFGARATGEPFALRNIRCDAADHLHQLEFPQALSKVMRVERTFWEKATAIHVFCCGGRLRGHRIARHWYDLYCLDATGHAQPAIQSRDLAAAVARHKSLFFPEKDASGQAVNYHEAVRGALQLVPNGRAREVLAVDYGRMVDDGLLLDDALAFDELMLGCRQLERRANLLG
ncbi:nucleotidyl transferase AbiEii/AbiGii toxin family protein [Aquibaculum sediminis]|uniref:nucleotidyl transferase AbiEii/AbiGii toxin family protein n=1 Tax=Aquibaculum sediminis TaxID=3231907 RepID=UPI003455AEEF